MLFAIFCVKVFSAFRFVVLKLQDLVLLLLCKTPDQPENVAKVMRVLLRYKQHAFSPTSKADFLGLHESFQPPEYVLHQDVSLYNIDAETATFVQLPPGTETYEPLGKVPYYLQQYNHATKVIEMPLETFCRLASDIPKPNCAVVTLANASKCGYSVLAEAVHMTGDVTVLWEPDAFTNLCMETNLKNQIEVLRLVFHYICRGHATSGTQGYFIKVRSMVSVLMPLIHREIPWVQQMFSYANPLDQILSTMSGFEGAELEFVSKSRFYRPLFVDLVFQRPDASEALKRHCNSYFTCMFGLRAHAVAPYLKARKEGVPVAAVKYESLRDDLEPMLDKVWNFCAFTKRSLPPHCLATLKSRLQTLEKMRAASRKKYNNEYNSKSKVDVDALAEILEVPRIDSERILDGTL